MIVAGDGPCRSQAQAPLAEAVLADGRLFPRVRCSFCGYGQRVRHHFLLQIEVSLQSLMERLMRPTVARIFLAILAQVVAELVVFGEPAVGRDYAMTITHRLVISRHLWTRSREGLGLVRRNDLPGCLLGKLGEHRLEFSAKRQ